MTLDGLEKVYIKDAVKESEYTGTCARLLNQYGSSLRNEAVAKEFGNLETFKRTWGVGRPMSLRWHSFYLLTGVLVGMPSSFRASPYRHSRYR